MMAFITNELSPWHFYIDFLKHVEENDKTLLITVIKPNYVHYLLFPETVKCFRQHFSGCNLQSIGRT